MNADQLVEALRRIKTIVDGTLVGEKLPPRAKTLKSPKIQSTQKSLPDHILALRGSGFFAQPKTYNEVHAKLAPIYPCDVDRVKVACLRLQKCKELRKSSKMIGGRSQVAYVW